MKTFSTYLKKINLILLLGGAVFVTGCNNDVSKLGLNGVSYRSDKTTDTATFSLMLNNEVSHSQRKQNLTRGGTAERVREAIKDIEELQDELKELAEKSRKKMDLVYESVQKNIEIS